MPEIRSLPKVKDYPGANPWRIALMKTLREMASDPTSLEVTPLVGMTRALKGTKAFHGTQTSIKGENIGDTVKEAAEILKAKYGHYWQSDIQPGELTRLADKLAAQKKKQLVKEATFKHFTPEMAGKGGGGNLYGEGIYLTEHPGVAKGYAYSGHGNLASTIRTHNIPRHAKILDLEKPLTVDDIEMLKKFFRHTGGNPETSDVLKYLDSYENPTFRSTMTLFGQSWNDIKLITQKLGYDGIAYDAGRIVPLPKDVPKGTKNYVIYNYDIINAPRKKFYPEPKQPAERPLAELVAKERQMQPKKVDRGERVGPLVQKAGTDEPYAAMPNARQQPLSPTEVSEFEIRQLTPPWAFTDKINTPWNKTIAVDPRIQAMLKAINESKAGKK